jgi:hypothetical protein
MTVAKMISIPTDFFIHKFKGAVLNYLKVHVILFFTFNDCIPAFYTAFKLSTLDKNASRRHFIKTAAITGSGMLCIPGFINGAIAPASSELYVLSDRLLRTWAAALLPLQVTDKSVTDDYGGFRSPDNQRVPGRVGDTIYPFFYMAHITKDERYLQAAEGLFRWMERRVSQPDGSWLNEPKKNSWKGTTVFASISLAETLKHHSNLMSPEFKSELEQRLKKAGEYIHTNFTVDYGNINYPVTASYALSLMGEVLDVPAFKEKARSLAHQALGFITNDGFLKGEGQPYYQASAKGCYPIDLGYNIEESLPALVLYGKLNNDQEVLDAVTRSLHTHLEFMLPDGGWDNSWGTRNYKWTYWGSRTSDGCQPAYALMADRDPVFYKAALANTKLLKACTHDGLLYGGPHYVSHGILPNVHHTFCHIKALATILTYGDAAKAIDTAVKLPREQPYGIRFFNDIQTWLVAKGKYRATVTGYDREYKDFKNGHATGGALTMLWHEDAGPLLAGSMNDYQLYEADNMQPHNEPFSMPLTPRIELKTMDDVYMNISDLGAVIKSETNKDQLTIRTRSRLVNKDQQVFPYGDNSCLVDYHFTDKKVTLSFQYKNDISTKSFVKIIVPIITRSGETIRIVSDKMIEIQKEKARVKVSCNQSFSPFPDADKRLYQYI